LIWLITKDDCPWCVKAKDLLNTYGYLYQELKIPNSMSKEEFYTLVEKHQTSKTVPKIFSDDDLIGGYEELADWIENHAGGYGDGTLA